MNINRVDGHRYAALLNQIGCDEVRDVAYITDEDLEEIYEEMKKAHKAKVVERVRVIREAAHNWRGRECYHCPIHCHGNHDHGDHDRTATATRDVFGVISPRKSLNYQLLTQEEFYAKAYSERNFT